MTLSVNPNHFLKRLLRLSLVAIVVTLCFSLFGIHWVYQRYVISNAELEAISISESILALESHLILHENASGEQVIDIDESEYEELNSTLSNFLIPFEIHKIKIFAKSEVIVYSTDKSLIGMRDSGNDRLANALSGINDSKLQSKDKIADLKAVEHFDVDVVESYIPIYDNKRQVIGSFEIYKDVTRFREDIRLGVTMTVIILTSIVFFAFMVSYFIIKQSAVELQLAQQKLHQMATIDSLTGLYSRNEIIGIMNAAFLRYKETLNTPNQFTFCLVVIDVDHFKMINDNYGHPVGDKALKLVSKCLYSQIRKKNAVGRFGGEEFLLVLPGETLETSKQLAERIRKAIQELEIDANGETIKVTASMGISEARPGEAEYHPTVKRADEALYEAKNSGRNSVVVYQD